MRVQVIARVVVVVTPAVLSRISRCLILPSGLPAKRDPTKLKTVRQDWAAERAQSQGPVALAAIYCVLSCFYYDHDDSLIGLLVLGKTSLPVSRPLSLYITNHISITTRTPSGIYRGLQAHRLCIRTAPHRRRVPSGVAPMNDDFAQEDVLDRQARPVMDSEDDDEETYHTAEPEPSQPFPSTTRKPHRRSMLGRSRPRSIRTPCSPLTSTIPHNNLPSAPASPPTPAPSPSPLARLPDWSTADETEEMSNRDIRAVFKDASVASKERMLAELLNMCDSRQLQFVHDFVCPRLKKDPFTTLPNEICLRVSNLSANAIRIMLNLSATDIIVRRPSPNPCPVVSGLA